MASQDYLIAIALIEQNLVRAMPLGGKEIKDNLEESENFKKLGEEVILNLLMRVFQRSDEGALKRASEEKGLLLVHMHPKRMQKELPFIKSEWIRDGDTQQFLKYLGNLSKEVWTASFVKYKGIDLLLSQRMMRSKDIKNIFQRIFFFTILSSLATLKQFLPLPKSIEV